MEFLRRNVWHSPRGGDLLLFPQRRVQQQGTPCGTQTADDSTHFSAALETETFIPRASLRLDAQLYGLCVSNLDSKLRLVLVLQYSVLQVQDVQQRNDVDRRCDAADQNSSYDGTGAWHWVQLNRHAPIERNFAKSITARLFHISRLFEIYYVSRKLRYGH